MPEVSGRMEVCLIPLYRQLDTICVNFLYFAYHLFIFMCIFCNKMFVVSSVLFTFAFRKSKRKTSTKKRLLL